jgi:prolyl-tRNA synthetase
VKNAYFPLLIPVEFLEREAEHVEGFAKECAVVTHHKLKAGKDGGLVPDGKLEKPYVIRPTSETIIGESFSKWVQSYRDLPMKINQWANIIRWEMRPRLFLRTSEFLWQEGHNVFETADEAEADAKQMLEVYDELLEGTLAISGLPGKKTEDEKFPGAVTTYTIESMMQDGKALQACTSHNLGQNFSKSSNIKFSDKDGKEQFAYTTSWGVSTRLIGGLIMSHSDDDGLVLPPKIAPYQAVIIPIVNNEARRGDIEAYCEKLRVALGEKILVDNSFKSASDKKWDWIRKGVPVRIEIGAREVDDKKVFFTRRDKLTEKNTLGFSEFIKSFSGILEDMHDCLLTKSKENLEKNIVEINEVSKVDEIFKKQTCFISIPAKWFGNAKLEAIMKKHTVTYRCQPFDREDRLIIGKSY